ncbi:MAG: SDR family NAD(P)-dependent oxidoreductase [Cellvibrionaceae bacterium]
MTTKTVFLTGASSGLGKGMAKEFAERGYDLVLTARRLELLEEIAEQLSRDYQIKVIVKALDVCDCAAVVDSLKQAHEQLGRLDVVIANAGIGVNGRAGKSSMQDIERMIDVNIKGLMATVEGALPLMRAQGHGQIVGLSSVAGSRGLPSGGVYGATKAAVTTYLEAVQAETQSEAIDVTILAPGYIDTPINQGAKSRPFVIPAEAGCKKLVDAIERRKTFAFVPGWPWSILAPILRRLPTRIIAKMA